MNSLFFALLWLFASLTGTDPCENTEYAQAYPDQCDPAPTPVLKKTADVTDISNGF